MRKRRGEKVTSAVHPNAGIRIAYSKKLKALIEAMSRSYEHWVRAAYRANQPEMAKLATDESPAKELERELNDLFKRWRKNFDDAAPALALWFAKSTSRRSELALKAILRRHGISVKFKMTPAMRDVFDATVAENVALIRSIPQQYHTQVQGLVMRSVQSGRDLLGLSTDLRRRYAITAKRAALISLDQNNKATAYLTQARQTSLGIEEGIWMHSHAGKEPRVTHLANDQKRFNIREGWYDPDPKVRRRILPGELIHCRCTWRPIVKGFS